MHKLKFLGVIFFLLFSFQAHGQIKNGLVIDSVLSVKQGIFQGVHEFLHNSPSYTVDFQIKNSKDKYIVSKKETDRYFIDFYTNFGEQKVLPLEDIWGFCDGDGFYIVHDGKPFQLMQLGQISLCRFVKKYQRDHTAALVTVILTGYSEISVTETEYMIYDLIKDKMLPYNLKNLYKLLSQDPYMKDLYRQDETTIRKSRMLEYIAMYNQIHPLKIRVEGIEIK